MEWFLFYLQINISQKEYAEKYRLYLERLNQAAATRGARHSREVMSSPHADETEEHAAAADPLAAEDDETDLLQFHIFRSSKYQSHSVFPLPVPFVLLFPSSESSQWGQQVRRIRRPEGVTAWGGLMGSKRSATKDTTSVWIV